MKKILSVVITSMFLSATAFAGVNAGFSLSYTMLETSGTETMKSSAKKNPKTVEEDVVIPSLFVEFESEIGNGIALGVDYVPVEAELGNGTRTDDDAETSGNNKASAEVKDHTTIYALVPVGSNGIYIKGGFAMASVDTTETLATGTKYGNEDVDGYIIGLGIDRDLNDGAFVRLEASYTDYDDVKFNGSFNGNAAGDSAVRNVVDADIDAVAVRLSVGKSF